MSERPVLVVATSNPGKKKELDQLLQGANVRLVTMEEVLGYRPEVPEDGDTFEANAEQKARFVFELTGLPTLADDSGLEVDALGGRPGVFSARYAGAGASDQDRIRKLLGELQGVPAEKRTARFRCVVCLVAPDAREQPRLTLAEGKCEGRILEAPRGRGGFGYDPVFWLPDLRRTMAELSADQKNERSHRGAAIRALLERWPL